MKKLGKGHQKIVILFCIFYMRSVVNIISKMLIFLLSKNIKGCGVRACVSSQTTDQLGPHRMVLQGQWVKWPLPVSLILWQQIGQNYLKPFYTFMWSCEFIKKSVLEFYNWLGDRICLIWSLRTDGSMPMSNNLYCGCLDFVKAGKLYFQLCGFTCNFYFYVV